jgi:membrane protease YdiL (CAAX protease family)
MESAMKKSIPRILISAIMFSLIAGIVVVIIGLLLGWKTSTQFSDGLFWAGVILFGIGVVSYLGYNQRNVDGPPDYSDSAERSKLWAADTFRGKKLMAFFGISALLLFGLSFLVSRLL